MTAGGEMRGKKGVLPQFHSFGHKPKQVGERGKACERCGVKYQGRGALREQAIGVNVMKVCDECHGHREFYSSTIGVKLYEIQERAMERFRNDEGDASMVSIGPRRRRGMRS